MIRPPLTRGTCPPRALQRPAAPRSARRGPQPARSGPARLGPLREARTQHQQAAQRSSWTPGRRIPSMRSYQRAPARPPATSPARRRAPRARWQARRQLWRPLRQRRCQRLGPPRSARLSRPAARRRSPRRPRPRRSRCWCWARAPKRSPSRASPAARRAGAPARPPAARKRSPCAGAHAHDMRPRFTLPSPGLHRLVRFESGAGPLAVCRPKTQPLPNPRLSALRAAPGAAGAAAARNTSWRCPSASRSRS